MAELFFEVVGSEVIRSASSADKLIKHALSDIAELRRRVSVIDIIQMSYHGNAFKKYSIYRDGNVKEYDYLIPVNIFELVLRRSYGPC